MGGFEPRSQRFCDATRLLRSLEQRIEELETRIAILERRNDPEFSYEEELEASQAIPSINEMRLMKRNYLVNMLENYWPEQFPLMSRPSKPKTLREFLIIIAKPNFGMNGEMAKHLLDNFESLIEFLKSNRFRNDPRQIANALAGVPELSFWRSLKLCGASPWHHGNRRACDFPIR